MKIAKKLPLILITSGLLLGACSQGGGGGETPVDPETTKISIKMPAQLNSNKGFYDLTFDYGDHFFDKDAKSYTKDLALISFASSIVSETNEWGADFFNKLEFSEYKSYSYDVEPTFDSIAYMFAKKSIDDYEVVAVSIRGFSYKAEWGNDFLIGETGDHTGFSHAAEVVYQSLQDYISTKVGDKTFKLWISGYSRAGAVANCLSSLILTEDKIDVEQSDMFTYTFEAPSCLSYEKCIAYENVHNISNQSDLITLIPPAHYGLGRCGVDHYIYNDRVSSIVNAFDSGIAMPEFVTVKNSGVTMENDVQLANFAIQRVFNRQTEDEEALQHTANTRKEFYDRYQEGLSYVISLMMQLSSETLSSMLSDLQNMGFSVITLIASEEAMADFIKPYLFKDNISFTNEKLLVGTTALKFAIQFLFIDILAIYLSEEYRPSLTRVAYMHFPEVTYPLLLRSFPN